MDLKLPDKALLARREVVGRGPVARGILEAEVEIAGLEGLQCHRLVAIVVVDQPSDIVSADVDRYLATPVVVDALVDDAAARIDLGDPIGAGADQRIAGHRLEVAITPVMLGQDRHLAQDQRQFTAFAVTEVEVHGVAVDGGDAVDIAVVGAVEGLPLGGQRLEAEYHVLGVHGFAVMEARFGAQVELDPAPFGVQADTLGQEPIHGEGLSRVRFEQGVVDLCKARGWRATNNKGIGRIEAALGGANQITA